MIGWPHLKMTKRKNNKTKMHWNYAFPAWIRACEESCGAAWFWWLWRHFAQPLSFVQTLSRSSSRFPCWFSQLAPCVTALSPLPAQAQGHSLQKELHCLQANQVSELLADTTSSRTQNCTSSNTSLPLYRLVCKEFSEVSILCQTLSWLPGLLWGKCTAGWGGCWITCLCCWEQLSPNSE